MKRGMDLWTQSWKSSSAEMKARYVRRRSSKSSAAPDCISDEKNCAASQTSEKVTIRNKRTRRRRRGRKVYLFLCCTLVHEEERHRTFVKRLEGEVRVAMRSIFTNAAESHAMRRKGCCKGIRESPVGPNTRPLEIDR